MPPLFQFLHVRHSICYLRVKLLICLDRKSIYMMHNECKFVVSSWFPRLPATESLLHDSLPSNLVSLLGWHGWSVPCAKKCNTQWMSWIKTLNAYQILSNLYSWHMWVHPHNQCVLSTLAVNTGVHPHLWETTFQHRQCTELEPSHSKDLDACCLIWSASTPRGRGGWLLPTCSSF